MFLEPVATVDSSPCRGWASHAADNVFASVFAVLTAVTEMAADVPATTTSVVQQTPPRSSVQGSDSIESESHNTSISNSPGSPAPQTMRQSSDRISTRTRRRSATAAGSAPPTLDYGFGPGGAPTLSSRRVPAPLRVPPRLLAPPASAILACRLDGPHGAPPFVRGYA